MASTNKTTHYELPQWIGTDKPTFLGDMNQAYEDIDTGIYNAATAASNAASAASSAQSAAATAQSAAESAASTASAANTLATTANTNAVSALNAIGSATLETVAQTINAAVNEVLGKMKANGQTAQITYDSTSQKYGVTIDQVFYPFEDSADFQSELYDALQYSGLVQEGDTVDEMLAALAAYFPELWDAISNTSLLVGLAKSTFVAPTITPGTNQVTISTVGDGTERNGIVWVDVAATGTESIQVTGTVSGIVANTAFKIVKASTKTGDDDNTTTLLSGSNGSVNQTFTLSTGEYIGFWMANNANTTANVSIVLSVLERIS